MDKKPCLQRAFALIGGEQEKMSIPWYEEWFEDANIHELKTLWKVK